MLREATLNYFLRRVGEFINVTTIHWFKVRGGARGPRRGRSASSGAF
jgi:hypothetical protein